MQIPLWFKMNRKEFDKLTGNIYNNDFKITINKKKRKTQKNFGQK